MLKNYDFQISFRFFLTLEEYKKDAIGNALILLSNTLLVMLQNNFTANWCLDNADNINIAVNASEECMICNKINIVSLSCCAVSRDAA